MCSLKILTKQGTTFGEFHSSHFTLREKTDPCITMTTLQHVMKCSSFQCENVNRGHVASIRSLCMDITSQFTQAEKNHLHLPIIASSITVCCMPDEIALRHCCSCSFKCLKIHSGWSYSIILLHMLSPVC